MARLRKERWLVGGVGALLGAAIAALVGGQAVGPVISAPPVGQLAVMVQQAVTVSAVALGEDLYILDDGNDAILRVDSVSGAVSIAVTETAITAATGAGNASFFNRGIAFAGNGTMYFTEATADAVVRRQPDGTVAVVTSAAAIGAATGEASADPQGIVFTGDGFLYVTDGVSNGILKINAASGAVNLFVTKASLVALPGITSVNLGPSIIEDEGTLYVASDSTDALFAINLSTGVPSVVASGSPFVQLDGYAALVSSGDVVVADDAAATNFFHRVSPSGAVSTFLSNAQLAAAAGASPDLEAGVTFDSRGNFYFAETGTDALLRFDASLSGEVFLSAAAVASVTGAVPNYQGGMAFSPSTGASEEGLGIIGDDGGAFTIAFDMHAGQRRVVRLALTNQSGRSAHLLLTVEAPEGIDLAVEGSDDVTALTMVGLDRYLLEVRSQSVGDLFGDIALTVESKDSLRPGFYTISGTLTQVTG